MADPVRPVSPTPPAGSVRRGARMLMLRKRLENYASGGSSDESRSHDAPEPDTASASAAAVGAQLLGEGPRRGLRAGPEVLEQARSTYLQTEYAGVHDRRPRKGRITKTSV